MTTANETEIAEGRSIGRLKRSQLPNPVVDEWGEEIPRPIEWL